MDLSERYIPNWVCEWTYACRDTAVYTGTLTYNQAIAIQTRLKANNGELGKRLFDGVLLSFGAGIAYGIVGAPIRDFNFLSFIAVTTENTRHGVSSFSSAAARVVAIF